MNLKAFKLKASDKLNGTKNLVNRKLYGATADGFKGYWVAHGHWIANSDLVKLPPELEDAAKKGIPFVQPGIAPPDIGNKVGEQCIPPVLNMSKENGFVKLELSPFIYRSNDEELCLLTHEGKVQSLVDVKYIPFWKKVTGLFDLYGKRDDPLSPIFVYLGETVVAGIMPVRFSDELAELMSHVNLGKAV